jgi:hypothetical protein
MTDNKTEAVSFDAQIVLRPRTIDETLDLALRYLRHSARDFTKVVALTVGIATAITVLISVFFDLGFYQRAVIAIWLSPFVEQVITVYGGRHLFTSGTRMMPAVKVIAKRLPRVAFTSALLSLPWIPVLWDGFQSKELIGVCALVGTFWPFLIASQAYRSEVSLLEQLSMKRAGQRTKTLITYRFARALALVILNTIIRLGFAGLFELMIGFTLGFLLQFGDVGDALAGWPAILGYLFAGPYVALVRMFDYVDARTRREGWDIQVRFNAIVQNARDADAKKLGGGLKNDGARAA